MKSSYRQKSSDIPGLMEGVNRIHFAVSPRALDLPFLPGHQSRRLFPAKRITGLTGACLNAHATPAYAPLVQVGLRSTCACGLQASRMHTLLPRHGATLVAYTHGEHEIFS